MPLTITIPERDLFDPKTNRFITTKKQDIVLEHSLLSISKWESKWHKPYLSQEQKTEEESIDYIRCMCISPKEADVNMFYALTPENVKDITDYISDSMTATTFHNQNKKPSRDIITNELVYYWMANFRIPFDPCEKWHFNRLMTLIEVAADKSQPPKKMSMKDIMAQNRALNAQRRARLHSKG